MGGVDYRRYIRSPEWKARRKDLLRARGATCEICGGGGRLHIHHLTYVRLFDELDSDLSILCDECHMAVHNRWSMVRKRAADRAVKDRRKQIEAWRKALRKRESAKPTPNRPPLKDLYSSKAQDESRKKTRRRVTGNGPGTSLPLDA